MCFACGNNLGRHQEKRGVNVDFRGVGKKTPVNYCCGFKRRLENKRGSLGFHALCPQMAKPKYILNGF